jgi:hypothetical protein
LATKKRLRYTVCGSVYVAPRIPPDRMPGNRVYGFRTKAEAETYAEFMRLTHGAYTVVTEIPRSASGYVEHP